MEDRSLQDEIKSVSAGLAIAKNALGRIMARSDRVEFREGYDVVGAALENVEKSACAYTETNANFKLLM